ncbi:MAG: hydrogenase nickel incorporation protein HypA [Crenarchaeota archaeon]|nr:hydrogenase nickel incorporation protein HypA [Thermoproteota archaeon]
MHEWALAEAVINSVIQVAKKEGLSKIVEVRIKIGELQDVERSVFRFALEQLRSSDFKDVKFRLLKDKAKLKCHVCNSEWFFGKQNLNKDTVEAIHFVPEVAHSYIKCPNCGSPDFEILKGRGVWLESVKGEK